MSNYNFSSIPPRDGRAPPWSLRDLAENLGVEVQALRNSLRKPGAPKPIGSGFTKVGIRSTGLYDKHDVVQWWNEIQKRKQMIDGGLKG